MLVDGLCEIMREERETCGVLLFLKTGIQILRMHALHLSGFSKQAMNGMFPTCWSIVKEPYKITYINVTL